MSADDLLQHPVDSSLTKQCYIGQSSQATACTSGGEGVEPSLSTDEDGICLSADDRAMLQSMLGRLDEMQVKVEMYIIILLSVGFYKVWD